MQSKHETLGEIIKNARMKADITVEDLATKVGVGERFIYRIENEGKKPSYDILYKLIRELSILPDQIFFPEKQIEDSEMESLVRMFYADHQGDGAGGLGQPAQRVKKSRCPWETLTGSSALRLCVWLFDDNDM